MTKIPRINETLIVSGATPTPIPPWCKFLIELGAAAAEHSCPGNRLIVAVVLPIRSYAATFTALGVVSHKAQSPTAPESPQEQFNKLKNLPRGQPLTQLRNGRKLKGIFDGASDEYIRIMVSSGTVNLVHIDDAADVEVLPDEDIVIPQNQTGRAFVENQDFIHHFIPGINITDFAGRSRTECAIIGPANILRAEITETVLSLTIGSTTCNAFMQDLIRVKGFAGEINGYRSVIVSAIGDDAPAIPNPAATTMIIFNGALGYKKWHGLYPNLTTIVLLDSTENGFREAAAALNQHYLLNRNSSAPIFLPPPPPAGVEIVSFHTQVK